MIKFLNKPKVTEKTATGPSLGPPTPFDGGVFTIRSKPDINDIHYNVNELQRLINQGVDVSDFTVAEEMESEFPIGKFSNFVSEFEITF